MLQREHLLLSIFRKMVKKNSEYHQLYGISEISTVNVMNSMVQTIDGPGFIPFLQLMIMFLRKITFGFVDNFVYRHGVVRKKYFFPGFNLVIYSNY